MFFCVLKNYVNIIYLSLSILYFRFIPLDAYRCSSFSQKLHIPKATVLQFILCPSIELWFFSYLRCCSEHSRTCPLYVHKLMSPQGLDRGVEPCITGRAGCTSAGLLGSPRAYKLVLLPSTQEGPVFLNLCPLFRVRLLSVGCGWNHTLF